MSKSITPHQDYVRSKLPGSTYETHGWVLHTAYDADAALRNLTVALTHVSLDAYASSLDYSPPSAPIDRLIARLQYSREHLTRALTGAALASMISARPRRLSERNARGPDQPRSGPHLPQQNKENEHG